jgi:hypothetical protein
VRNAEANLKELKDVRDRDLKTLSTGAVSPQDIIVHEQAYRAAGAHWP